jgi:hypothetical protein
MDAVAAATKHSHTKHALTDLTLALMQDTGWYAP